MNRQHVAQRLGGVLAMGILGAAALGQPTVGSVAGVAQGARKVTGMEPGKGQTASRPREGEAEGKGADLPKLPFEKYVLANGLEVILSRNAALPVVSVNVWYHVGPADEEPGRTGFAHLFEHMMFQCSRHVPCDTHFKLLEGAGASDINGTTDFDRTNYYETVPTSELELALWLEADRMGWLLDKLDLAGFMNQQDVVRNERRQSYENAPYGMAGEAMYHLLFPKSHPYYANVIGSHADIQAATLENVKSFFKQFYVPNNATLAISGDFDPAVARQMVEKYFGTIARGAEVKRAAVVTPPITSERRETVKDRVQLERVEMAWLTPPIFAQGSAEATIAANLLGEGKSSRLYKTLVYDKQLATAVNVYANPLGLCGLLSVSATARPGHTAAELEAVINSELESLRTTPVKPEELERAVSTVETSLITSLERSGNVADRLNLYNHYLKEPGYLATEIAAYRAVTPESVRAFAAKFLPTSARAVVVCVPGEPDFGAPVPTPAVVTDAAGKGAEAVNPAEDWRSVVPSAASAKPLTLPPPESATLSNGLTILLTNRPNLPLVAANLVILGGRDADPVGRPNLAAMTAGLLDEGTEARSAPEIADEVARLGGQLGSYAAQGETIVTFGCLKRNFRPLLALAADVVIRPSFSPEEVERQRASSISRLAQSLDFPNGIASRALATAMYGPEHPFRSSFTQDEASYKAMTRDEIVAFWKDRYAPGNAALIVAGDVAMNELRPMVEQAFGGWKVAARPLPKPAEPKPTAARLIVIDKPGAQQTALAVGSLGLLRSSPDVVTLEVANYTLGGLFSSRINMNLREDHGYTYGAGSSFSFGTRTPGAFAVRTSVRTDVTAPAVREIQRELAHFVAEPVSDAELALSKRSYIRALPGYFETSAAAVQSYNQVFGDNLGLDYYRRLPGMIDSIEIADIGRTAKAHIRPEEMVVVAVGDLAKILEPLRALNLGPVEIRDVKGELVEK